MTKDMIESVAIGIFDSQNSKLGLKWDEQNDLAKARFLIAARAAIAAHTAALSAAQPKDVIETMADTIWCWMLERQQHRERDDFCDMAKRTLAALSADGYVIVPREPTPEMLDAGYCDAPEEIGALIKHWESLSPEDIWPAMIDAASKGGE